MRATVDVSFYYPRFSKISLQIVQIVFCKTGRPFLKSELFETYSMGRINKLIKLAQPISWPWGSTISFSLRSDAINFHWMSSPLATYIREVCKTAKNKKTNFNNILCKIKIVQATEMWFSGTWQGVLSKIVGEMNIMSILDMTAPY